MRDIRDDLTERIEAARAKKQKAQALIREAEAEETSAKAMLEAENRRLQSGSAIKWQPHTRPRLQEETPPSVREFLDKTLRDGKPRSQEVVYQLAEKANVMVEEGKFLRRSINAALQFMLLHNLVEKTKADEWVMKRNTPAAETAGALK